MFESRFHHPRLPLELIEWCLSYTEDPHLLLHLETVNHAIHAARLVLPGECETHIGREWPHSISAISRLAALHHQLDRVASLTLHVDSLPEHFFQAERCRALTSLTLQGLAQAPACLGQLQQLRLLRLAGSFSSLPEELRCCSALQQLAISSNTPASITTDLTR
ncbi:hypothetical protein OEZ86_008821 [Tetradesmus obliquus]|nr:hypothetical protein OEZ86_008821 [Tetradesmus obliquus]